MLGEKKYCSFWVSAEQTWCVVTNCWSNSQQQFPLSKLIGKFQGMHLTSGTLENHEVFFLCPFTLTEVSRSTEKPLGCFWDQIKTASIWQEFLWHFWPPLQLWCSRVHVQNEANNCRAVCLLACSSSFCSLLCCQQFEEKWRQDRWWAVLWSYTLLLGAMCIPKISVMGFADKNTWRHGCN